MGVAVERSTGVPVARGGALDDGGALDLGRIEFGARGVVACQAGT